MTPDRDPIGLCATCRHSEQVRGRAAIYYLCARSRTDPRFPKYPNLPVMSCPGYEPKAAASDPAR